MGKVTSWKYATEQDFRTAKLLVSKGVSQNEVGRIIGKSGSTINRWCKFDSLADWREAEKESHNQRKAIKELNERLGVAQSVSTASSAFLYTPPPPSSTESPREEADNMTMINTLELLSTLSRLIEVLSVTNLRLSELNENIQVSKKWWSR